jgi:putative CRISPR-associated protein (TIGR02619 family)
MARNLIITCGTSQIEEERLRFIKDSFSLSCPWTDVRTSVAPRSDPPQQESAFDEFERKPDFQALVDALSAEAWKNRQRYVGQENNPFGAEISTLVLMEQHDNWHPTEDHIVLLSSATDECVYCTALVATLLRNKAGVDGQKISKKIVPKLNENPENVEETTKHLAKLLAEEIYYAEDEGLQNVLAITGGYKAVIPCLTVFSLVFGIEMYYLFEKSGRLQLLNATLVDLSEQDSQEYWKKSLDKLTKRADKFVKNPCLKIALKARMERPERPF